MLVLFCRQFHFNPLPPHGGRRTAGRLKNALKSFQSTPSAWRETFFSSNNGCYSIHFNPLPPHGGRHFFTELLSLSEPFQSTPSAWRETAFCSILISFQAYFNPLPPHGGRLIYHVTVACTRRISIHSLRMEGDRPAGCWTIHRTSFQSTPSAWRETREFQEFFESSDISIHSLRMEGDIRAGIPDAQDSTISIHSLRMEGDSREPTSSGKSIAFQSTPSAWRETYANWCADKTSVISIHSLRMEGDCAGCLG